MDRRRAAGALIALAVCITTTAAAPTVSNHTALDLYDAATEGCYYNFQHYGEGDRIMTNEPCLNCTCHNRMLMCYLRVCPFTKPIGQDCTVEKRADQCCPIVTCPDVPVDLLTSTSTSSPAEYGASGVGKLDKYGCSINGKYFSEGSKVPPTPNKPCEHCYCIRNMTTCVMQECTLHVDGCTPIYHKDVCCPVRYSCDHEEDEILGLDDMSTTVRPTPGFLLTTTTESPVTQVTQDCIHNYQVFADGTSIKTEKACEHCYCMKGDIVCVVQECGTPMENEGKNCTSQAPRHGQCCPDTYICEGDELTTELPSDLSTQPLLEELTTLSPPKRTEDEGSGYRNEPDEPVPSEIPVAEPEGEGSGDELITMQPLDVSEKYTPGIIDETFASTEDQGLDITKSPVEDEKISIEPDSELNTVPSGVSEPSVPKLTTLADEMKSSEEQEKDTTVYEYSTTPLDSLRTTKESVSHTTESSFRKEDELHPPTDISTLEPAPTIEIHDDKEEIKPTIEDDNKITKPSSTDDTLTVTTTELSTSSISDLSKPVNEPSQSSEHTVSEIQTTTIIPERTESTTVNAYENEIEDNSTPQETGRIPGEGDCLQAGITYRNDSSVPSSNNCQTDCKCVSSIIKCDPIICSPPPEYMSNCVPTYDSSESCCPTYVCDGSKETLPPQPHSQMSETETSTPTPAIECHDGQCDVGSQENKTSSAPGCTSEDCLTKPSEIPELGDCGTENCKDVEQAAIQPVIQTDCGPTGCDGKTETTHHEPSSVPSVVPESCSDAECKPESQLATCDGENCKPVSTEGCQNEEDCKNVQDIPKDATPCEGDSCREISVDCTSCDELPPIQQPTETCKGDDCKKPVEEPVPECTEDSCRRTDTADVEGKLPTDCTDSNCLQQKPEAPELSVSIPVSTTPEKIPEQQNEVTPSPEITSDQGSSLQTDLPYEADTKEPQSATDNFATESSTAIPKVTEPQTVEIKQTSELQTIQPHDITTEVSDTKVTTSQPQDETLPLDKTTTIAQPPSVESHTHEHEIDKDISQISTTMASEDHVAESSTSTGPEDSVTKVPDILTPEPHEHTTHLQGEITTKKEDEKLPEDTEQELTTQSSMREQTDLAEHTDQELITKSPMFTSETTAVILEKESVSTTPTSQFETTEKTKVPEVPDIHDITTESPAQEPLDTKSTSDAGEKSSTEYPSVMEEKTEVTMDSADMAHTNKVTSVVEESATTLIPEITHFSYEPETTKESGFTTPPEVYTDKPDVYEPVVSTTDLLPTMKEKEPTDISKEPEAEEQRTTITPLISLEPELETEMPTSVTDIKDVPIKTDAPLTLDEDSKEKLPEEMEDKLSTESQETYTEETLPEEPSVTEHGEFSSESSLEPELPDYIPVHPPAIGEKEKPEQPDKEIPMGEDIPETTQSIEVATQEPVEVTQTHVIETDTKVPEFDTSDEFTQSPHSELPESYITEVHSESEPVTTASRVEAPETATQSKPIDTEEEDILKTTEVPDSFVKDTEEKITPETTDVDISDKEISDKIQTEPQVTITPDLSATKPSLPELGLEDDSSPKPSTPENELEESVTTISDKTTEQYDHSETLPDMIELVEHHPIADISTESSISDETTTVSYKKPSTTYTDIREMDKDKIDDTSVTMKPIVVSEMEHKPETESDKDYHTTTPSVTHDIEQTYSGEISTIRPLTEVDHAVTADEKLETERPETSASEQTSMPDKEPITEKTDISDIEPEVMPTLESSTQNPETPENEQEMILKEKPETPIEEEFTQPQESFTEKEIPAEPEYISKEPGSMDTEYTTEPGKVLHTKPSEIPGMEAEKETTMKTPISVTEFVDSTVEPETLTSSHEITSGPPKGEKEIIYTTSSESSVTEYPIPDQETVTKSEVDEDSVPGKAPSTEKIGDIEEEVTPETEHGATESESPTTEIYIISSHEPDTRVPESIGIDTGSKTDMDLPTSTQEPESTKTEQEIKPDKESSTTISDTMNIEDKLKPDEKISTIEPEIPQMEHEGKPDKEDTNVSEVPLDEHKVKPDIELSTEQQEILDIDKEETPEIDVTPKEQSEMPTTEHSQSQESVTGVPEPTLNELEAIPESTEKSEIADSHKGSPEPGSMTKEPVVDHDVLPGYEPTTKEPVSTDIEDVDIPHEQATDRPQVIDTHYETQPGQETVTLKPEIPVTDYVTGQDFTTESENPEIVQETQPDKEPSAGGLDMDDKETFTEQSVKPDIELQSSTKEPEILEIEPHYSTERSEVPEIEQQPSTEQPELPELELQHFTEPSEIHDMKPQSSTEPSEISEVEPQSSTEQPEIPKVSTDQSEEPVFEPPSATERLEVPEIEPQHSTESSELSTKQPEISEIEPQSTEPSQVPEIEPQSSTELPEYDIKSTETPESEKKDSTEPSVESESVDKLKPDQESSTERSELPEVSEIPIKSYSSTESSEISEVEPHSTTERAEIPESEIQSSSEPSAIPEIEPQSSTEQSEVPKIEPQASTEIPEYDIKSTGTPESEKKDSTEPSLESETVDKLKPDQESSTERSELPETEHEIEPSTERLVTPEIEYELKPTEGSSTEQTETTELETKEPQPVVTIHDGVSLQTSTALPATSESEQEIKSESDSSTELSQTPETTDKVMSILPSESHTQSKPIEEEILVKTTTEVPSSVESSTTVDKELYEKSTETSVPVEKTTPSHTPLSSSPEAQDDNVKQDDLTTLSTTSRYPLKEEATTAVISEFDKTPTPEIEIPVQTERDTEKPTEVKDTTAPEEEFLAVTTKATTPKMEEVKPTESSAYDKFTKPHGTTESELLPSSIAPEIPKPGFNEVQATDEIPSPEDDGHFAPSATGGYGGQETDYEDENQPFGPGTCRYGGKVYVSAQQIPRDDPCDFCFCFRSDIICLQQSCPPPIHGCHEEPIQGFCCPRYECPVSMANTLNITTTTTTTTTTLPPHFNLNAYQGAAQRRGCQIKGHTYKVGEVVRASSGPCLHCTCGGDGQMKCDPKACTPEPMLRQMIAAAVSAKRRR